MRPVFVSDFAVTEALSHRRIRAPGSGKLTMPPARAGGIALFEGIPPQLEPCRVANDVARGGGHRVRPARTGFL
jgi:hypothetical protein